MPPWNRIPNRKSNIQHQLHQRQQDDRPKRPVEDDDHRARKLRRDTEPDEKLAPAVKLQRDQRKRRRHYLDRERQLQRPNEAGQDQQIDRGNYRSGNWVCSGFYLFRLRYTNTSTISIKISCGVRLEVSPFFDDWTSSAVFSSGSTARCSTANPPRSYPDHERRQLSAQEICRPPPIGRLTPRRRHGAARLHK